MELGGGVFILLLLFLLLFGPSEALPAPCSNGGTAVGDTCVCPPGHSGHRCDTPDPAGACRNGGTAVGTACFCPPGFGGPRCQLPDPASACHNGATTFGTRCVCPPGFRGDTCRELEEPGSCLNGGTLEKGTCRCPPTAWGPRCECTGTGVGKALYVSNGEVTNDTVTSDTVTNDTVTNDTVTATTVGGDTVDGGTDTPPARRARNVTARPAEGGATTLGTVARATTGRNGSVTAAVRANTVSDVVTTMETDTVANANTDHDVVTIMETDTVANANTDHDVVTIMETDTVANANTDHDVVTTTERDTVANANTDHDVVTTTETDTVANANTDHDVVTTTETDTVANANTDHDVVTTMETDTVASANTDHDVVTTTERDTVASANTDHDVVTTTERDTRARGGSVPVATTAGVSTTAPLLLHRLRNGTASPAGSHAGATTLEGDTTAVEGDTTAMEGDTTVTLSSFVEGDTTAMEGEATEGDTEATPVATTVSNAVESDAVTVPPGHLGSHSRATSRARNTTAMGDSSRATTLQSDATAAPVITVRGHTRATENGTRATTLKSDTGATTLESHPTAPANVTSTPAPPNATETSPNATKATGPLGHVSAGTTGDFVTMTTTPVTDGTYGDVIIMTTTTTAVTNRTSGDFVTSKATSAATTVATICLYLPHGSSPPAIVCHNGGVANRTHCLCPPGYSGPTCETPDPSDRCAGGSTAVGDRCICPPGRSGPRCATPDPATACRHGGTAVGTECYCPPAFSGPRCEDPSPTVAHPATPPRRTRATPRTTRRTTTTTVPTTRDPCVNGGRWTGVACLCPPNIDGPRCEFGATTINLTAELGASVTMMARVTNRDFSEDMGDASSPRHRRFAEEFRRTMDGIYRNVSGYRGIDVLSLSRGSVVVNFRVQLRPLPGNASLEHRALELLAVANAASQPHNCSPSADGLCFTATSARATRAATLALNDTELCRRKAPANFSRFYFPYRTATGLLCITNCSLNVPGSFDCHRGLCRLTLDGPQCLCPDLPWYLSTGDRCQTHISKLGLGLGVGLGLGLTILILLILCIVLTVRLTRGRKKSPGARVTTEDSWPDGGRSSRVTGIYHVNGRDGGAGKGPYNTYKPSSEVAEPPVPVLAEGAAAL